MNNDGSSFDYCGWIRIIRGAQHVIVNHAACDFVPNLDSEFIQCAIRGCQHKAVIACAVYRTRAFVLRLASGNHQPIIRGALEVQVGYLELEFRIPSWNVCTFLIFRVEWIERSARL